MIWVFYFRGLSNFLYLTRTMETERDSYNKYQREIFCVSCNKDTLHASDWLDGFKLFLVSCGLSIMFIVLYFAFFGESKLEEEAYKFFSKKLIFSEQANRLFFVFDVISIFIQFAILSTVVMYILKTIRHFTDSRKICTVCNPEALSYKSKWKEVNKHLSYKQSIPAILIILGIGSFCFYLFHLIMWFVVGWTFDQFLQEFLWFLY